MVTLEHISNLEIQIVIAAYSVDSYSAVLHVGERQQSSTIKSEKLWHTENS